MFMSAVVLETTVSTATYYSLLVQYAVFFRVLPCVIAAPVYYAVFFRVRLLLALITIALCIHVGTEDIHMTIVLL